MLNNRSVPTNTLLPHVAYRDVAQAIAWLARVFGFVEHYRYGDPQAPSGAQMHFGDAWIMVHGAREHTKSPAVTGGGTQMLTIFVDDVERQYAKVKAAGAIIWEELQTTIYGEKQFGVEDLDGHHWLFSQHALDISPEEWGATVVNPLR
jgi:uncharacterized glyoxalase superfamily protein PhnB